MKRIYTIILAMIIALGNTFAQDGIPQVPTDSTSGWKHAFSPEGRKNWKGEYTLRYRLGFFTQGAMLTGSIKFDEKRTLGLFLGHEQQWDNATPADIYSIRAGLTFRRYWHLGKRKTCAFYCDVYAGAGYVYKVTNLDAVSEKGEVLFVGGIQPGFRVRCYKNLHLFLGPTIATDCIGAHLGIGF